VRTVGDLVMGADGAMITGSDFLVDGLRARKTADFNRDSACKCPVQNSSVFPVWYEYTQITPVKRPIRLWIDTVTGTSRTSLIEPDCLPSDPAS
jgi:hypothetical protein